MTGPVLVALLVASGVWLVMQKARIRTVLGFVLLSHAVNVFLVLSSTGSGRAVPILGLGGEYADPLPQAFALTAIVIAFGVTAFLLALASDTEGSEEAEQAEQTEQTEDDHADRAGPS